MISAAKGFLENGKVKIYCPASNDAESWYNKSIPPNERAWNQEKFDRMISTELVPWAQHETGYERMALLVAVLEATTLSIALFVIRIWRVIAFPWVGLLTSNNLPMDFMTIPFILITR